MIHFQPDEKVENDEIILFRLITRYLKTTLTEFELLYSFQIEEYSIIEYILGHES